MNARAHIIGAAALALLTTSCSGGEKSRGGGGGDSDFECNERSALYIVRGGFVGFEGGVTFTCTGSGPRVERWRVAEQGEARQVKSAKLSTYEFDDTWKRINSAGWQFMAEECDNPDAAEGDPSYVIAVKDHRASNKANCQGADKLPFPHGQLVDELDLRAAGL